jgi:pimeloyl-ACP methyl ester carboxylesterase
MGQPNLFGRLNMSSDYFINFVKKWCEHRKIKFHEIDYQRHRSGGIVKAWRLEPLFCRGRVTIVHGTGNSAFFPQIRLIQRLLLMDLEVFCFDLDGHGKMSTTILCYDESLDCVEQALKIANTSKIYDRQYILGHSLGGTLAVHAAPKLGMNIDKYILISAPIEAIEMKLSHFWELTALFSRSLWQQADQFGFSKMLPALGPFRRQDFPIRTWQNGQSENSPWNYLGVVNKMIEASQLSHCASQIRQPCLLIYGKRDHVTPIEFGRKLKQMLPNSQLKAIDKETHFTTLLSQLCETWIVDFLKSD